MKTKIKTTLALFAAVCGLQLFAATPVAVFEGADLNGGTVGGYTLALNGNTYAKGAITITSTTKGVSLTSSSTWNGSDGITAVIQYSSLAKGTGSKQLASFKLDSKNDCVGVRMNSDGGSAGTYAGNDWSGEGTGSTKGVAIPAADTVFVAFKDSEYTKAYKSNDSGTRGATALYYGNGLREGGKKVGDLITIASMDNGKNVASGMVITGIAIYNGFMTSAEMAAFKWSYLTTDARWGNIGDATNGGCATQLDQLLGSRTFNVKFGTVDNICTHEFASPGTLFLKKVRVVGRKDGTAPSSVTITPNGGTAVASSTKTDMGRGPVYKSDKSELIADSQKYFDYAFDTTIALDASKQFTMAFGGDEGYRVMKPANSVMQYSSDWAPIVEFVGDFYADFLPSEKYHNQMGGSARVPADTYDNITVPGNGYRATALTGKTELSTSGAGIGGNFNGMFQSGVDVASHTVAGWFKVDELPASDGYKLLWKVKNDRDGDYDGYAALVGSDGKIYVGRTLNNNDTPTIENYNAKSSEAVITAGKWCHLVLSFEKSSSARTATLKVYKNGGSAISFDATSNTGCNGGTTTSKFYVGAAGISVAGFYIDNGVLSSPTGIKMLATNPKYVDTSADYTLEMKKDEVSSTAGWSPTKAGAFGSADTLTVNDTADSAVTLTFDENTAVKKISATSEAGKELTLAKDNDVTVSSTEGFDFSGANGKVTVGFDTGTAAVKAGADTVLNGTGTGTLTIDANKQATVKNWSGSNLSGAGMVVYNADAAATAVSPGAFANAFTGSIKLTQGTWTVTADFPQQRPITVDGANAKLTLNGGDVTGYSGTLPHLVIQNGGTLYFQQRDTFSREIELRDGAFVDLGGNRTWDLYSNSKINVYGSGTTSVIGGTTRYTTTNSGSVCIRRSNLETWVQGGATLAVYAQWGDTAYGRGNACLKTGPGTVEFYRASVQTGAYTINAGTIKMVNAGSPTTGSIVNNATLELNATEAQTVANVISGSGSVTKTGTGTTTLTGANTYSGTTTVSAGTLVSPTANLGTGLVTISDGATLKMILTAAQVKAESVTLFKSSQEADVIAARTAIVDANNVTIPGTFSKDDDNNIKFAPSFNYFTRTIAAGGTITWTDSGWTKDGVADQPCTPSENHLGSVTVTLSGDATIILPNTAATTLYDVSFVKADGVEAAAVTFKYVIPDGTEMPEGGNVLSITFPMVTPTLASGVTASYAIEGVPEGYLSFANGTGFGIAKKSDSISIKFGPRDNTTGRIGAMDANVGGYPVAGYFWNHSKNYNDNNKGTTEVFQFKDGNGATVSDAYCFYYTPNTYFNGNGQTTGNGKMTKSYFDDTVRITPTSWPYEVTDTTLGTFYLPKAPGPTHFNMGWEVGITNIPYQVFDLYVYHASDQTTSITLLPMAVKANDGEWKYFKGDTAGSVPCQYNETWSGDPSCDKTPMVEGVNYVRYRLSADALGLPEGTKIEQVFISHPSRSDVTGRLGLAGIQIVKVASTGVYKRKADPVSSTNWTEPETWISGGASATWKNPEGSEVAYAQINADNVAKVTVDNAITSTLVTVTSAATSNFTLDGAGELTGPFDLTGFWGALTLSARYDGEVSPAGGRLTLDNAQNNITFATAVSNVTLSAGTLKLTSASLMTADSVLDIAGGTFDVHGIAFTRAFTMSGGSLVNNGNSIGTGSAQMNTLELTGNASIGGTGNFGLIASKYGASTLTLGDNTLTKTGANSFWLCNTTISGAGTIQVDEGTLAVNSDTAKDSSFADGTISVGASGALLIAQNRTLTVKNVTLAAANGVTATGTLKVTGALDATAAGATIGNLTLEGTPTVKLTAEPLAITTLGFGTDATTVNFDFTGAPFSDWATAGVTSTQMVSVASFPMARLGTITGVPSGWYLDITANGLVLTTNGSKESTVSDQTDLGNLYVPGTETLKGTGGAIASALAFAPNAKIVIDPVRTPLKVNAKPVFKTGAKIALASAYAETSLGKLTLISWVGGSLGLEAEGLKALVDETTFASGATYTVEETGDDTLRQLVLKIGDYDNDAKDVTISQFGDSITEGIWRSGYRGTPNYRIPLMQMLEAKGYRPVARGFRNVMNGATSATLTVPGSSDANGVPAPEAYAWHNGISAQRIYTGMTSGNLRAGFMESVEAHLEQVGVTDIITLKIGTNDAIGGETAENIFQGYTNLVWKIKNMRPTTQIYLCSPIPNHNSSEADARAKAAAASMKAYIEAGHFGGNVFFVDGYNAVPNEAAYYLTDGVHPNWNGHMKLAERFCTDITTNFTPSSPHAIDSYTAKTTRTAETNVPEAYRNGYVKLLTFTNVVDKATAWTGGVPYTYTNTAYVAKKFDRIAYYVENKTKVSPDTRFVWVDMDAAEVGRSLSDFCIPTNVQKNVLAKNLHVYSNSSAVENIEPTVEGVNGTIMLTSKGCTAAGGITGAPDSVFGLDWNDTLKNDIDWGIMTVSRTFSGVTRTNHRIATEAQILFDYNGYNLAAHGNSLGIGDFAVHCKQSEGNSAVSTPTLNWIFASDNITKMNADNLDYGVVEIWGKVGPATLDVSAEITDATTDWSQLEWTDSESSKFTGLTGAYNYTLTGAGKAVALTETLKDGATVTLSSGTLNLADGASIGATSTFSIAADATLGVTTTNVVLKASKVTNSGTIAFNGGTAENPIEITGDATSNFGTMTLAANTHVYNKASDNRKHLVTGVGATSCYYLDGHGLSDDTSLNNLTLVSLGTGNGVWIERGIGENVRLTVPEGKGVMIGNDSLTYNAPFIALNGSGEVRFKRNSTLTITCTEPATYSGTSSIAITIGGTAVQTLSGAYTGALTVNEGATVALGGSAAPSSIVNNGTVKYLSGYTCNLGAARSPNGTCVFEEGSFITATETRAEHGAGGVITFTGFTAGRTITLHRLDGTDEILTVDEGGQAVSETKPAVIDQMACLYDITFTNLNDVGKSGSQAGTISYRAVNQGTLQYDNPAVFYTTDPDVVKERGDYIRNHPYLESAASVLNGLNEFTAVLVGKMSATANTIFVFFGSAKYNSSNEYQGLMVVTTPEEDGVAIYSTKTSSSARSITLVQKLTVPNSATTRHVYIITKRDVAATANEEAHSVFTIYLDGTKRAEVKSQGIFTLGRSDHCGMQVGADFGGGIRGYNFGEQGTFNAVPVEETETGVLNVCRLYDYMLSDAQVAALKDEYPYITDGGRYSRDVTGAVNYQAENTWKKNEAQTAEYDVPTGTDTSKPSAKLTATGEGATITVNTNSVIDTFTFKGAAMTFVKDATGTNTIEIATADISAPVTVKYGAIDFVKAAVSLTGGSLTFDMSDFPLANCFTSVTNQMTGMTERKDDSITMTGMPTVAGRTPSFAFNTSDSVYNLIIEVAAAPFVYTVADAEPGQWSFHGVNCDEPTDWTKVNSTQIQKAGAGKGTIARHAGFTYSVTAGTLVLGEGDYGTVAISAGAALDVGTRRDVTVSGEGTVDVKLTTQDEQTTTEITAFNLAQDATTTVGKVYDSTGVDVTSHVTKNGNKFTINHEAKAGTTYYITLAKAIGGAAEGDTITMLRDASVGDTAVTLNNSATLVGDNYEITGAGIDIAEGKTLTVKSGAIGVGTLTDSRYALQGGKYKGNTWTVASGYRYVKFATEIESYNYQIVEGAAPAEEQKAYPVEIGGSGGLVALDATQLAKIGCTTETPAADVKTALESRETSNKFTKYENLVLGFSNTVATDVPYPAPVQGTSTTQVSLKLGSNVSVDTTTGAKVTYKVKTKGATGEWTTLQDEYGYGDTAEVDLPGEGVKYYKFDVIVTPAK